MTTSKPGLRQVGRGRPRMTGPVPYIVRRVRDEVEYFEASVRYPGNTRKQVGTFVEMDLAQRAVEYFLRTGVKLKEPRLRPVAVASRAVRAPRVVAVAREDADRNIRAPLGRIEMMKRVWRKVCADWDPASSFGLRRDEGGGW